MPKTLTTEWENSLLKEIGSGADDNKLKIEYDSCINKIGNLTLLEHRWNKKIKNSEFTVKANGNDKFSGYKDSNFNLTKMIATKYKKWGLKQIKERSLELAESAYKIWIFN